MENRQILKKVSPRYVYIAQFNPTSMEADVYCLARGTFQTLEINKQAYKNAKIETGQLVYCIKFEKLDYGYGLLDYKITEKIEEQRATLL